MHIGHLLGALSNWVRLQDEYETYHMVADWHALTTDYANTSKVAENSREMVIDWLTVGIDPAKSVIFRQSDVAEHAELFLILSMISQGFLLPQGTWILGASVFGMVVGMEYDVAARLARALQ